MFSRCILGIGAFLCAMFGLIAGESNASCFNGSNEESSLYSVDPGRLFVDSGRLYLDSDTDGPVLLESITYSAGGCFASFSAEITQVGGLGVCTVPAFGLKNIDIKNYGSRVSEPMWQCPYCNRRWKIGEPCGYKKCPAKLW